MVNDIRYGASAARIQGRVEVNHKYLGQKNGPLLLFGGPLSNTHALSAVSQQAMDLGLGRKDMICTGDVVGYCGSPYAAVSLMMRLGSSVIAGNVERQLANGSTDCGCGFEAGSTCDALSKDWYAHAQTAISPDQRRWMDDLPDVMTFEHQGARYGVIHGGATDIARFVWSVSDDAEFEEEWSALEAIVGPVDHVIAGHSGIPFVRKTAKGNWINAGVIGMPPHDGAQQTRFAILDGGEVVFHRLSYDVEGAVKAMESVGLTQGYNRSLLTGYWPSDGVLPLDLRAPSLASG